ncbi:MAG: DUF4491 family protein [Pyramidobacter sp.]|nr:DUF4491 family protein [Pyramidobacter sp.]
MFMNWEGAAVALASLAIIAVYHPLVIKAEYLFTSRVWPAFALCGIAGMAGALFLNGAFAAVAAFWGATNLWCVFEVHAQAKRVEKGWFPKNPNRR